MNNVNNTWTGIRSLITWKQSAPSHIHFFHKTMKQSQNSEKIANIFNDYLSTIAEKAKAKIRFSYKSPDEFLQHANENSFFLKPTSSDEIINVASTLNESKSDGFSSLPTKILKLIAND